jgi:hypothetical protein
MNVFVKPGFEAFASDRATDTSACLVQVETEFSH